MTELWNECPENLRYRFLAHNMLLPIGEAMEYSKKQWADLPLNVAGAIHSWFE